MCSVSFRPPNVAVRFSHLYEIQQLFEWNFNSSLKIIWLLIKSGSSLLLHAINTHILASYISNQHIKFYQQNKNYGKQCTLCTFLVSWHQRIFLFDVWWIENNGFALFLVIFGVCVHWRMLWSKFVCWLVSLICFHAHRVVRSQTTSVHYLHIGCVRVYRMFVQKVNVVLT